MDTVQARRRKQIILGIFAAAACALGALQVSQMWRPTAPAQSLSDAGLAVFAGAPQGSAQAAQRDALRSLDDAFAVLRTVEITVEPPEHEPSQVMTPVFLRALQQLTKELTGVPGVQQVVSLTQVADVVDDEEGGVITQRLVDRIPAPEDAAALQALRDKVLARPDVVGNLISANLQATSIICVLSRECPQDSVTALVQLAESHFGTAAVGVAGAPALAAGVAEQAVGEAKKLLPWGLVLALVAAFAVLRDVRSLGWVLAATLGCVLTALPVAQALHIFVRLGDAMLPVCLASLSLALNFQSVLARLGNEDAATRPTAATHRVTPSLWRAGLLTSGLLAAFWAATAGTRSGALWLCGSSLWALCIAMWLLPTLRTLSLPRRTPMPLWPQGAPRWATLVALSVLAAAATQLKKMNVWTPAGATAEAFTGATAGAHAERAAGSSLTGDLMPDTPLDRGRATQQRAFATAETLLIDVQADLLSPAQLTRLDQLANKLRRLDGVSAVTSALGPLRTLHWAMAGSAELPDSREKMAMLMALGRGDATLAQLLAGDAQRAVVIIKMRHATAALRQQIETQVQCAAVPSSLKLTVHGAHVVEAQVQQGLLRQWWRQLWTAAAVLPLGLCLLRRPRRLFGMWGATVGCAIGVYGLAAAVGLPANPLTGALLPWLLCLTAFNAAVCCSYKSSCDARPPLAAAVFLSGLTAPLALFGHSILQPSAAIVCLGSLAAFLLPWAQLSRRSENLHLAPLQSPVGPLWHSSASGPQTAMGEHT